MLCLGEEGTMTFNSKIILEIVILRLSFILPIYCTECSSNAPVPGAEEVKEVEFQTFEHEVTREP